MKYTDRHHTMVQSGSTHACSLRPATRGSGDSKHRTMPLDTPVIGLSTTIEFPLSKQLSAVTQKNLMRAESYGGRESVTMLLGELTKRNRRTSGRSAAVRGTSVVRRWWRKAPADLYSCSVGKFSHPRPALVPTLSSGMNTVYIE